ncbi:Bicoid-interacting protein 3-domain-containing protein [Amylocystis lapponica]|nr:Bicoid-interacting protein 3-domain-containing protein [Amylocystis lapponica]
MPAQGTTQPIHGNYHGSYYSKRPFVQDARLAVLSPTLFQNARVLDVGCNEGWVTCEIARSWRASKVVGVDIDDTLIRAAWKRRRTVWSSQEPRQHEQVADDVETQVSSNKRKRKADLVDEAVRCTQPDYFPMSCEHMFGPLPIPAAAPASNSASHEFPHNITFRTADWVRDEIPEDTEGYDVVLAFSISKWIHLNGGDDGITRFFRRVYSVLKSGGAFVLEPQEWETYAKAKRMDATLRETAKDLKLRPDDFEHILREMGFGSAEHLGRIGEGGFRRSVDIYYKLG